MKSTTLLIAMLAATMATAQTPADMHLHCQTWSQDLGQSLANLSTIYLADSTAMPATADMGITWWWYTLMPDTAGGPLHMVLISHEFDLDLFAAAPLLHNGEFQIYLQARANDTGRQWGHAIPCGLAHQAIAGQWPPYMPYPASLTALQYRQQHDLQAWAAPHIWGSHYQGTTPGDMNTDGTINTQDLLLFLSAYGTVPE